MPLTADEIVLLAATVRRLQRDYYSYRDARERPPALLGQCKAAEHLLDKALKEYQDGQRDLFAEHVS
jgi:hypothetical protein